MRDRHAVAEGSTGHVPFRTCRCVSVAMVDLGEPAATVFVHRGSVAGPEGGGSIAVLDHHENNLRLRREGTAIDRSAVPHVGRP
jgi:hypothetical protein